MIDSKDQHWEWFAFGSVKTTDYGVWVSGEDSFTAPERDIEDIVIPGRNGTLTIDNGRWKNITISYPCYMSENFMQDFQAFKYDLLTKRGYLKLVDSYHPNYYRKARLKGGITPTTGPYNRSAKFTVSFDCWPQLYLAAGDEPIVITGGSGTITGNVARVYETAARPVVQIMVSPSTGTKSGSVTIGSTTISFSGLPYTFGIDPPVTIDCEARTIERGGVSVAEYFTLDSDDFFYLMWPSSAVSYTGDVLSVSVTPRWWTL